MRILFTIVIVLFTSAVLFGGWFLVDKMIFSQKVNSKLETSSSKHEQAIQLEILNSTNVDGLANKMMNYLRKRGFDVVRVGNYSNLSEIKSIIIERSAKLNTAVSVAQTLGIADSCIYRKPDSTLFLNCTVVIGNDYKNLAPFK